MNSTILEEFMRKMDLGQNMVALIMICVKIVSFLILINGEPHDLNPPRRGPKQGDPLSSTSFFSAQDL